MDGKFNQVAPLLRDEDLEAAKEMDPEYADMVTDFPHVRGKCTVCYAPGIVKEQVIMEIMSTGDEVRYVCVSCLTDKVPAMTRRQVYDKATMDAIWRGIQMFKDHEEEYNSALHRWIDLWQGFADDVPDDHPLIVATMDKFKEFLDRKGQGWILSLEMGKLTPKEQFDKLQGKALRNQGEL